MTNDERLSAYLDGQLDAADAATLDAELKNDSGLAAHLEALRTTDFELRTGFADILNEPVPERLTALLKAPQSADIVDFASAKAKREFARPLPGWANWRVGGAIAAGLAVLVIGASQIGTGPSGTPEQIAIATALETTPMGQSIALRTGEQFTPTLSFSAKDGRFCREFSTAGKSEVACKGKDGWQVEATVRHAAKTGGEGYQVAGGEGEGLDATYKRLGASDPISANAEKALIANGWNR